MYAKIENGMIKYISGEKIENGMIKLTEEQTRIIQEGGRYENGEFIEAKKIEEVVDTFVEIKIPLQVFANSEDLQKKLLNISLLFSEIQRKTRDGIVNITNINIKDIPEFLTEEEYTQLKSVGVVFSEEVDALFSKKKKGK